MNFEMSLLRTFWLLQFVEPDVEITCMASDISVNLALTADDVVFI